MRGRANVRSIVIATAVFASVAAQQPPVAPVAGGEDAAQLASAWSLIAANQFNEASEIARRLMGRHPRSSAILLVGVEAEIGRGGAVAGLDAYEHWLGTRVFEEAGALRRVARAILHEQSKSADSVVRLEALKALVRDGDADAATLLLNGAAAGRVGDLRTLASIGNADAVDRIVRRMASTPGDKMAEIAALGDSGSDRAVAPLIEVLADKSPQNRSRAADALGRLGKPIAIAPLKPLLSDPATRASAAGALFRLGDMSGESVLQEMARSEHAAFQQAAAAMMASRPDEAWKTLVRGLLTHPDPSFRVQAAGWLAPHEPDRVRPILDALAVDANPQVRDEASLALVEIPTTSVLSHRQRLRTGTARVKVGVAARLLALTR